jgi:hypothetical protein
MTTCDCTGPGWPVMKELSVGGTSRWFVCPDCGVIKEWVLRPDGTIEKNRWHKDYSALPKTVQEQIEAALKPQWIQPALFDLNTCAVMERV